MIEFTDLGMDESHADLVARVQAEQRLKPLPRYAQPHDAHVMRWVGVNFVRLCDEAEIARREGRVEMEWRRT